MANLKFLLKDKKPIINSDKKIYQVDTDQFSDIDPVEYRAETRNSNYPYIPLPDEIKEAHPTEDCVYTLWDRYDTEFCAAFQITFTDGSCTCEVMKYKNTALVSTETVTVESGVTKNINYSDEDDDWDTWNYIIIRFTGQMYIWNFAVITLTKNGLPLSDTSSTLIEMSGSGVTETTYQTNLSRNLTLYISNSGSSGQTPHRKLEYLSFTGLGNSHTVNVKNFKYLCQNLYSLRCIPILEINSCTYLDYAFSNCYALVAVKLSGLNSSVTTATYTFMEDWSLKNVYGLENESKITTGVSMFQNCRSLERTPDMYYASMSYMTAMFSGCYSLADASNIVTTKCTLASKLFHSCYALTKLPETLDFSKVTTCEETFYYCRSLKSVPDLNLSACTVMANMFHGCTTLKKAPTFTNTNKVTSFSALFRECTCLEEVPAFDMSAGTNFQQMFYSCAALKTIPTLTLTKGTNFNAMFQSCKNIRNVDITNPAATTSTSFANIFRDCYKLETVKLSKYICLSAGTNAQSMFNGCYYLTSITLTDVNSTNYGALTNTFNSCYHLAGTTADYYNPTGAKDCYIHVPSSMVDTLKAASVWSTYASQIVAIEEE